MTIKKKNKVKKWKKIIMDKMKIKMNNKVRKNKNKEINKLSKKNR
jgi:hypothetical protein